MMLTKSFSDADKINFLKSLLALSYDNLCESVLNARKMVDASNVAKENGQESFFHQGQEIKTEGRRVSVARIERACVSAVSVALHMRGGVLGQKNLLKDEELIELFPEI